MKKIWYISTIEFYSVIKKNNITLVTGKQIKLEIIMVRVTSYPIKTSVTCFLLFVEARGK
jgi:hypothetical protein